MIPYGLVFEWMLRVLMALPVLLLARLLAPLAVLTASDPRYVPRWARWIAPADHDLCGPRADPMWVRWWESEDGGGRAWYVNTLKRMGVRSTAHWAARLLQLWRNGGAGAMYTFLGVEFGDLWISVTAAGRQTRYLAYRVSDTSGIGAGRTSLDGARPVAFYVTGTAGPIGYMLGWKLNHPVEIGRMTHCKLVCSVRRAKKGGS